MRNAGGEIPEVTFAHVVDEALAFRVEAGDAGVAVKHDGPLGGSVPVKFANAAGGEAHVDSGDGS